MANPLKRGGSLGIVVVLVIIIAAFLYFSGNKLSFYSPVPLQTGGITLSSLTHLVIQNQLGSNFSGSYFLATFYPTGSQSLIGSTTPISISAPTLASALTNAGQGNFTAAASKVDTFNVQVLRNNLLYPTSSSGQYGLYTFSLSPYTGQFSFTNCDGQTVLVSGTQQTSMGLTCFTTSTLNTALQSYINGCKTSIGSQGNAIIAPVGSNWSCFILKKTLWATLYPLGNVFGGGNYDQAVQVQLNGVTLSVSTNNTFAQHLNSTGKVDFALQLFPTANGQSSTTPSQLPSLLVPTSSTTQSKLYTYSSYTNMQNVANNVTNQINQIINYYEGTSRGLQICTGTVCAGTSLNQTLSNINAYQVTTLNQQPLANQSFQVVQTPSGSGQSLSVQISDSNFQIITPVVQIISSLPYMGLTYAVAQCNIVSQSPAKFNSGASGTATVTVKNTGISGGCTAVANMPSPFYTPTSYTGSNGRFIAQGGQFTYSFPIYSSQAINNTSYGFTAPITFTVCSAASAGTCSTVQTTATENPVCSSGFTQAVNGSNCQPLITTTAPTTTIPPPNVCGGLFQPACNTTTVTTTIPVTCQPPSQFNQTLFNEGINPPCWIPKGNSGDNTIYYIIGAIIVIAIIAFLASGGVKVKGGGGEGKRPVGRPRLDSMVG